MSAPGVTARAPAKAILIGEHAVNRGSAALAISVGLWAHCRVALHGSAGYHFHSGPQNQQTSRAQILSQAALIDHMRQANDYAAIQQIAASDYFAPAKYALAGLGEALPPDLAISFESEIPQAAGLGSGGATVVALLAAVLELIRRQSAEPALTQADARTTWVQHMALLARRGDIVAHGGIASGLDSQTSLYGGLIRYTVAEEAQPLPLHASVELVIGNTGVFAATSAVNGRVRTWLDENPVRMHYFAEIALLARHGQAAIASGDWPELGRIMNMNQLILERIGVSCPQLEALNEATLAAGAYGAKLSGSGGGGIMLALVDPERRAAVIAAIAQAGGTPISAPVGVPGATILEENAHGD